MNKAIMIDAKDNVAVAIEDLEKDDTVAINNPDGNRFYVLLLEKIPIYHKFAIDNIECNANIIKYGEHIGVAGENITVGCHVHIHNVLSKRENLRIKNTYCGVLPE